MKKTSLILIALILVLTLITGCGNNTNTADEQGTPTTTLVVGASVTPHAEILNVAKEILAEEGIELKVVEFADYVQPNINVESGDLDANYFQHKPYLDQFNKDNNTHLVSVAAIHYEPFGIYAGKTASIDQLADGAIISVPNDGTNEARALYLLEAQGLIKLKEGVGFSATVLDIAENPKNLVIKELEAAQLTLSLPDVDLAVINGNYAIQAGLNATSDALAIEDKDSEAAQTYANIICVKEGNENDPAIQALCNALKSDKVKEFIENTYEGAVVPMF
ncbi:MAG: ABC transporter substrate-binding protein [Clostridia bacterium]|nr:ABC transporter substrate-binding protein [Clostridia bacterium]